MSVGGFRLAAGLAFAAGLLSLTGLVLAWPNWSPLLRGLVSLSGILALAAGVGSALAVRRLAAGEWQALAAEQAALSGQQRALEAERKAMRAELDRRTRHLERRESDLADRMTRWQEWMEFPLDPAPDPTPETDPDAEALRKRDQAVIEVVRDRTDRMFERIKTGRYYEAGAFHRDRVGTDIIDLFESVARVYNPHSRQPLLETSFEQLLRSISRASLQLLVVLDELPLDLKRYNLRRVYETIQKGARAYGLYQNFTPYWTYLRPVYYAGRFTLGANPVTLGVTWALGEAAKAGAQKFSTHMANRYALGLLYELAFIVGAEAAGIFGGDFRHREPDWIFGAELTELLRRVPLTPATLREGLNEVGKLQLRSEYDRVFLYRCLAAGRGAKPERYDCRSTLSLPDRQLLAERLEVFRSRHVPSADPGATDRWVAEVEDRLGVRLRVDADGNAGTTADQAADALRCLAGFLMEVKRLPAESLAETLSGLGTGMLLAEKGSESVDAVLGRLADAPPMLFDYPDLDPSGPVVEPFLDDLADLAVRVPPRGREERLVMERTARHFRRADLKKRLKKMDRAYAGLLAELLAADSPERRVAPPVARMLLGLLAPPEIPRFLYRDVRLDGADETIEGSLWLLGTRERVRLVLRPEKEDNGAEGASGWVLWEAFARGEAAVRLAVETGRFGAHCVLSGGRWEVPPPENATLWISGPTVGRRESYFAPLRRFAEVAVGEPRET